MSPPRIVVAEATWSRLGPRDARRELDRLRAKARLLPIKASSTIYVLAARELRG